MARARPFGLASATGLVVASMIGAGVFTTSGYALADLGNRVLVLSAWLVGGVIALAGAVSYGRLAARIQESGGEYVFLSRVIHPAVGFVAGWVSLLAGFTGAIAFAASAFEAYALPVATRPAWLPEGALAIAMILSFAALHALVMRVGLRLQNLIVLVKLVLIAAFLVYASVALSGPGWAGLSVADEGRPFSLVAFAGSLVWISLGYSGFNAAVYVTGEVRDPGRTVPRALVVGTLCVIALYLALNAVFLFAPLPGDVAGRADVATASVAALGGSWLAAAARAAIALALLTSVSSLIVTGPRVYAQMARDGVFPARLAGRGFGNRGAPAAAIALQAALAALVVLVATLEDLLSYLGFTLSLSAAGTVACLFVLRSRESGARAGEGLVAPAFYVTCTTVLAVLAAVDRPWQLVAAITTLAGGFGLYALARPRAR